MTADKIEAYTTFFLSSASMLSIDIQMTVYKDEKGMPSVSSLGKSKDGSATILAVDDVKFFLNRLKTVIQEIDSECELLCESSAKGALRLIKHCQPDLFILDIEMPEMDGYELAQKIREAGQTAPIIFLTGNSAKEYVVKAIEAGAADFILKPITKEIAADKICKYIW